MEQNDVSERILKTHNPPRGVGRDGVVWNLGPLLRLEAEPSSARPQACTKTTHNPAAGSPPRAPCIGHKTRAATISSNRALGTPNTPRRSQLLHKNGCGDHRISPGNFYNPGPRTVEMPHHPSNHSPTSTRPPQMRNANRRTGRIRMITDVYRDPWVGHF